MSEEPRDSTADVVVSDPDAYNRTQRFQEIHDARQRVAEYVADLEDKMVVDGKHTPGKVPTYVHEQLAFRVSLYVMELLPLLAKRGGEDPYMADEFGEEEAIGDLRHFARRAGMLRSHDGDGATKTAVPASGSLRVFQVANQAFAKLGMEIEVSEAEGDAGFDYSDVLEDGPPGTGEAPEIATDGEGGNDE